MVLESQMKEWRVNYKAGD